MYLSYLIFLEFSIYITLNKIKGGKIMYNLNKKQKIILGILVAIVAGFVCYYVYAKDEGANTVNLESDLAIQEEMTGQEEEQHSDDRILVHISGAVNKEGIVELKIGSRIADAIDKAGGIKEDADIEEINLAYLLEDGMKIKIPNKQEKDKQSDTVQEENIENYVTTSIGVSNVSKEEEKSKDMKSEKVNINTATQTELETLPGIGPSTAMKIITYRKEKGKFMKKEEIKEVSGIGESKYNKIKDLIVAK
jgi:competence protein ComEA